MKCLSLFFLFDLVELSQRLASTVSIEVRRHGACELIFIHVFEREVETANAGNHLAYLEMSFWENSFHAHQGTGFLEVQGFLSGKRWGSQPMWDCGVSLATGIWSIWRFFFPSGPVSVACSSSTLSLLTPELAVEVVESVL